MKLQEFFDTQKNTSFTDIDKLDLYQNILYKKTKKASLKRSSFVHAKYFIYSMVFVTLIFGLYGVYFVNNGQENKRFAIKSNTTNTVQADYIAQVIDVKGNFFIEHNGILATTNNIGNGDTILLKEDTQLVFEINSGTQSKIIGPAKLVIQKTNTDDYKLNLIYGDFIQMEGNEKTQSIELAVNNITIKQQDKSKPVNFKFVKNGEDQVVQNNGANIVVTKSNGTDKTTTLSNKQVVTIQNNDIKVFANIDTFTKAVQEKNISQTFAIDNTTPENTTSGTAENKEETLFLSLLNTPQISELKEEITKEITSVLGDEKKILEPEQDEKVRSILYEWAYTPELDAIGEAFTMADDKTFDSAYIKLEKRIQTIYQIFGLSYSRQAGDTDARITNLKTAIASLEKNITNEYNIPPKYIENLQSIEKSLSTILAKWYGSSAIHESASGEDTKTIQE